MRDKDSLDVLFLFIEVNPRERLSGGEVTEHHSFVSLQMTPGTKKTILTSKTTGRRYFLVRSSTRPNGRRYYICSKDACKARVSREADLYCRT